MFFQCALQLLSNTLQHGFYAVHYGIFHKSQGSTYCFFQSIFAKYAGRSAIHLHNQKSKNETVHHQKRNIHIGLLRND